MADTITGVLDALDRRIDGARRSESPLGYFAALYRKVTARVKKGIEHGEFEDGARMERLDVVFANRYLDAFDAWDARAPMTDAWTVSFHAARAWPPIVLQHLLLGMNAHINLDLGIAAATVAPGQSLPALRRDFDRINLILASLMDGVKRDLEAIWPLLVVFDSALGTTDDTIANFSMQEARGAAWCFAEELAALPPDRHAPVIARRDAEVAAFGRFLLRPGFLVQVPLLLVRVSERGGVRRKIEVLAD